MRAVWVLVLVVLAAGPGRPENATRGLDGSVGDDVGVLGNATDRGLDSGNPFWDQLYWECGKRTSLRCVQKSAFRFLKKSLGEKDVSVTDSLVFRHNHNALTPHRLGDVSVLLAQNKQGDDDDGHDDLLQGLSAGNALPSVEDITDDLYDQGMSFIKSHDVHLRLPSMLGGAEVRLSPRAFEEDGATFKISFSRPHVDPSEAQPGQRDERMFFSKGGIIKRITQKLFKKKLMTSFFALLLIVKMIKVKLMFLLPLILGVGTAKKLLLKVLLFLFPALSHLFKLCSYYHANYAKYHHHHHKIAHHHHVIPVPVPQPVPASVGSPPHHGGEIYSGSPPHHGGDVYSGSAPPYSGSSSYGPTPSGPVYGAPPPSAPDDSNPFDYGGGGGGGGYEYPVAHNRIENLGVLPANQQNSDVLAAWGLGAAPGVNPQPPPPGASLWDDQRVYRHTPANAASSSSGGKRKQGVGSATPSPGPGPGPGPSLGEVVGPTVQVAYDAFYSPLLQRMDDVFVQLGFNEEACRERLVCSMYKSPGRFAPHSNLISAELSRDPSELQKPSSLNSAVVRFYRYVQAARDGQNAKDCMLLYPACTVNTELR